MAFHKTAPLHQRTARYSLTIQCTRWIQSWCHCPTQSVSSAHNLP